MGIMLNTPGREENTSLFAKKPQSIQAGAGIVAASDPEREYEETLNKAQALLKTLKLNVH